MKADIEFPHVKGVTVAIGCHKENGSEEWKAYLINENDFTIYNVLVASKGYGELKGERKETSILRQHFDAVAPGAALIELLDPELFNLCNEFWISYYSDIDRTVLHDKKFVFMPGSVADNNLSYIPQIKMDGVLHGGGGLK
jgi:hypothetical protein